MSNEQSPSSEDRLPAGRHGLPRETVIAIQRRRLLAGAASAVVEVGYASLTVADITKRASVSRVTFYQLFEGKTAVLIAAFDEALAALRAAIAASCASRPGWPENVVAALEGALGFVASSPCQAALLCVEAIGIEPALAERSRAATAELAALLRSARADAAAGSLPTLTEDALIGGARSVIAAELARDSGEELAAIAPQLAQLILTPYLGHRGAREAVHVGNRPVS